MPSINWATGREMTVGLSSSVEILLRSERAEEVLDKLLLPEDLMVPSVRQLGQAKSPFGMR